MAKIVEFPATSNGAAVTLFYDDAGGLAGGWGVNDGTNDMYRRLNELLAMVEMDRDPLVTWIANKIVDQFKAKASGLGQNATAQDIRDILAATNNWLADLQVAATVPPTPIQPPPEPEPEPAPSNTT